MTRFGRRGLIAAVVAVAVAATVGATALAVTAHGTNPNNRGAVAHGQIQGQIVPAKAAPAAHHWSIAASGFAPDHIATASPSTDYFNRWDFANLSDAGGRCFNASVHIPNGATIKSVTFYYTNGATNDFYGELNRQGLPTKKSAVLARFTSTVTGTTPKYTHTTVKVLGGGLVDTSRFAYGLGVCPQGDSAFSGAIVSFTG